MTSFVRTRTRSVPVTPKFPARFTDVRVLHTDACPANLYVTASGGSALGGFNEAMSLNSAEVPVLGLHTTTEHTAPELLEGAIPTAATDVYGVAVTLFELLAGHPAFPRYR